MRHFCNFYQENSALKYLFTLAILLIIASQLPGQIITVINAKTGEPLEGVILHTLARSAQTNSEGEVSIDQFNEQEVITFQHSSFLKTTATKKNIRLHNNQVRMVEDPIALHEVVISVNRREQLKTEIPNKVVLIGAEEILRNNPQTTADLLVTRGEIFIQKSQQGGGSPMIRGFSANRLLIVVDGIRMNNAIYRSGNLHNINTLDANLLENTEIILGPGSVIYGSDALGGVMSFNTLKPRLNTHEGWKTNQKYFVRYASANQEKTAHAQVNMGGRMWAALAGVTVSDFDDLKMGAHGRNEYLRPEFVVQFPFNGRDSVQKNHHPRIQRYSGYGQLNAMGKLRFQPTEKLDLNLAAHLSTSTNIPRYDRLIVYKGSKLRYGDWYYGPQKWQLVSSQISYRDSNPLFDQASIIAGYQNYTESRHDRNLNNPELFHREENLSVFSLNLDFNKKLSTSSHLFYGLEGTFNRVHSTGHSENLLSQQTQKIAPRYPDGSIYESGAGYAGCQIHLGEKISLQAGTRFTATHLKGKFSTDFYPFPFDDFHTSNEALIGNLGMVWRPTPDWQINLNASTGFRSPNLDDIAKVFDSEPGNVIVPNPGLNPEYARNIETSIIKRFDNKARFEVTAFYTQLKDAMVRRQFRLNGEDSILYNGVLSKIEALVNADEARIYGASLNAELLFSQTLRTSHSLTVTRGEDSDHLPVRHVPPLFGISRLIFENQSWFAELNIQYNGKISFEQLAAEEREKPYLYAADSAGKPFSPAWWTLNVKTSWQLSPSLTLSGGVENILNKRYRPYSSGIVAAGTNAIISLMLKL